MKCRKCGINNPINVNRCIYCGASLTQSGGGINNQQRNIQRKNSNFSKKQADRTDNIIVGVIAALVAVFLVITGIYAFGSVPKKSGFSGGGGGGGGIVSTVSTQPNHSRQPNNDIEVSLDGDDPDVEIYSFNTDIYDILVGETKNVTFTAEIFANVELEENDVSVVSDNGNVLGYMNDNGSNGDTVANDGIYTLQKEMYSVVTKNILYQVQAKNIVSECINICFYKEFTEEDLRVYDDVVKKLNESVASFVNEGGYLIDGKYDEAKAAITKKLNEFKQNGVVLNYTVEGYSFPIQLTNEIPFLYEFLLEGVDSGIGGGSIATYQPFKDTYAIQALNEQSDAATDGSARAIVNKFNTYSFARSNNYDLDDVTLDAIKTMSGHSIIIWHGHGGWTNNNGSLLCTGEQQNWRRTISYSADIFSGRIIQSTAANRQIYSITGGFVEKYLGDMSGSMLYLAACSSGKDMLQGTAKYKLADSFIKKGALAVVANSDTICTDYNTRMERDVFKRMIELNSTPRYYNLSEALTWAKEQNGDFCCETHRSYPVIFPQNNHVASTYALKDLFGNVAGTVKAASTGEPIKNALVRIYNDGYLVKKLRTGEQGYYSAELPVGDYVIKITKGHYKSAKIAVNISEGATTYVETLLMIDAGINSGFANGIITDAVSGEDVNGVSLKMRSGWNNKDGRVLHTTSTNENGYYEISFLPGFYTIEYSKDGYITGYKNIIIGIVDYEAQNAVISPEMPDDGNFRIVLSWSNKPKDLDAHLTGPTVNGGRFHLYYEYANTSNRNSNSDYYQLDLDNTDIVSKPNISETTTIVTQLDGVYRYSVHDYTNRGNGDSDAMSQSNATVNVYKGSVLVATYHVPPNVKGSIWTVFELSGDEIKPINKIGNGMEDDISKF